MATLQQAKKYSVGSTLILGEPQTGRTSWVINKLRDKKVLWVSFNNLGTVAEADTFAEGSQLVLVSKWDEDVPKPETGYDAIVLDGLNYATGMYFTARGKTQPTQQDWGQLSNALSELVLDMRKVAPVYCIVDVEKDAEGKNQVALNRASYQGMVGLFDVKVRTVVKENVVTNTKVSPPTITRTKSFETIFGKEALQV